MTKKNKKFYIAVDLEGLACVVGSYGKGLSADSPNYQYACLQGTREAAAAAKALFSGGAEEVYIWDNHGTGVNLNYDLLDERVKIVMGAGSKKRFPCITSDFDGVLLIGYHAYDTPYATLSHVYSSMTYQYQKINGVPVGEMQIDASIAGHYGVPVVFVSSDDICVSQAKESFGDIVTVVTKQSLAWNSCISKHPCRVCKEIEQAVSSIFSQDYKPSVYKITEPFSYEIRFKRTEYAVGSQLRNPDNTPFALIDAYTRKGVLEKPEQIFEF